MISLDKYAAFLIFLCCLAFQTNAQTTVVISNMHRSLPIKPDAIRWKTKASKNKINIEKHGARSNIHYTSFTLSNASGADGEFVLQIPKSGVARMYTDTNGTVSSHFTGSLLPLPERSLVAHTNGFRFFIRHLQNIHIRLELESIYSIYVPRDYTISVTPVAVYEKKDNLRLLWQGIFLGVILVMALYNLFIGIAVRDINYFYYVLSIIGIGSYFAFYYGFGIEYLWKEAPVWDTFCYLMIVPFNGLTRLLFTRTYLHTPKLLPWINIIMNAFICFNILLCLAGFFAYATKTDIILPLIRVIAIANTAVHCLMLAAGMVAYYKERYQPAKFFIWANIILVLGAILFIVRELGFIEDNFLTRYLVQIGFLIQVVVFSLGLASRLNTMRSQLSKETIDRERMALESEIEKKELIEEQRKELVLQVARQTADLQQKNLELESSVSLAKESENKMAELNQIKDKLFSIISHDLRNPLATMQSFIKLITEHHDKLTEEENEKLYIQAQQSLDNLNELMYNLLQWSRSQMNLLEFKQEKLSLKPLLDNQARVLQLNAHMKNINISVFAEEGITGYADKVMVEFIIRNLVSNAIKFSRRNNEVNISAMRVNGTVTIAVKDNGVGITEPNIKKILGRNSTLSKRGTEKEKGTGLGLLICKEFIEKNNGTLMIQSEPGKGSVFSFSIQSAN